MPAPKKPTTFDAHVGSVACIPTVDDLIAALVEYRDQPHPFQGESRRPSQERRKTAPPGAG